MNEPGAPPLRLLIVDDEALARLRLAQLIAELTGDAAEPGARVVAEADSTAAAQAQLARHGDGGIDALLLDIGMPGSSGLALAATLRGMARPPAVVFVTAHAGHALQAFELQAVDYLTKPVRRERLLQALARVAQWRRGDAAVFTSVASEVKGGAAADAVPALGAEATGAPVLVLEERGRVLRLPHAEIVSLRAEHKTVRVQTAQRDFVVDESLSDLEQRLGAAFVRIHRNALVARGAIRAFELRPGLDEQAGGDGWAVQVGGAGTAADEWLPVSRRQVVVVRAAITAAVQAAHAEEQPRR